jgi:hypothetical protein
MPSSLLRKVSSTRQRTGHHPRGAFFSDASCLWQ